LDIAFDVAFKTVSLSNALLADLNAPAASGFRYAVAVSFFETYGVPMDYVQVRLLQGGPYTNTSSLQLRVEARVPRTLDQHKFALSFLREAAGVTTSVHGGLQLESSLAQAAWEHECADKAALSGPANAFDSMGRTHMAPHQSVFLQFLRSYGPSYFDGFSPWQEEILGANMHYEFSAGDIDLDAAQQAAGPPPAPKPITLVAIPTATGEDLGLSAQVGASASEDAPKADRSTENSDAKAGTNVLVIIVPLVIIAIGAIVYLVQRNHNKVQVAPTASMFAQSKVLAQRDQKLPERGISGYPDRTISDVRSNQIRPMPSVSARDNVDQFAVPPSYNGPGGRPAPPGMPRPPGPGGPGRPAPPRAPPSRPGPPRPAGSGRKLSMGGPSSGGASHMLPGQKLSGDE